MTKFHFNVFFLTALFIAGFVLPHSSQAELRWTWENPLPQGSTLRAIWGSSSNDIHAVGNDGSILHYDGQSWVTMRNSSYDLLNDLWGSGANDVYAVGRRGNGSSGSVMLHFDGNQWSELPEVSDNELTSVWGTSAIDVYIGGWNGRFFHFDGNQWTGINTGSNLQINGIWASGPNDIFVVGSQGRIRHFNGSFWSGMTVPSSVSGYSLIEVWGRSGNDVYALGRKYENSTYYSIVLHYDGTQWRELQTFTGYYFCTMSVTESNTLMITDNQGRVLFFDGSTWQERIIDLPDIGIIYAGWAASDSEAYFVGSGGDLVHWDGTDYHRIRQGSISNLYGLWCGPGQQNIAVGSQGLALHYLNGRWQTIDTGLGSTLLDVWGADAQHVFAISADSEIIFFNGTIWSLMDSGTTRDLHRIWGSSSTDVFVAGRGLILHYDGSNWTSMALPPFVATLNYKHIWGSAPDNVYAVSSGGTVIHYDGNQWLDTAFEFPSSTGYYTFPSDIGGTSANDIQAILTNGPVYRFDGLQWSEIASDVLGVTRIEAIAADNYWYAGTGGIVYQYDGLAWNLKPMHNSYTLTGICQQSDGSLLVAGSNGSILRYSDVDEPSSLSISSPQPGSVYDETSVIMLDAVASDPEDGVLSTAIHWASDISGPLGQGDTLYVRLTPGIHTLTASVTDSGGNIVTRSVQISVLTNTAPTISGFWSATPVTGQSVSLFIFGHNFTTDGSAEVRLNGILQPLVSAVSSEMLIVRVLVDPTQFGPISVTTPTGTGTSSELFGNPPSGLQVTGIWPAQLQAGVASSVFLFGSGFTLDGMTEVYFNGMRQYLQTAVSGEMIIVRVVPDANLSGPVTVTVPDIGSVVSSDYLFVQP